MNKTLKTRAMQIAINMRNIFLTSFIIIKTEMKTRYHFASKRIGKKIGT